MNNYNSASKTTKNNPLFHLLTENSKISPSKTTNAAWMNFQMHYPREEQWRLLVDGAFYGNFPNQSLNLDSSNADPTGWTKYEDREPGSIKAFFKAWQYCQMEIFNHPGRTDLTLNFIKNIHKVATENVAGKILTHDFGASNCTKNSDCQKCGGHIRIDFAVIFSFHSIDKYRYTYEGLKDLFLAISNKQLGNAQILKSLDLLNAIRDLKFDSAQDEISLIEYFSLTQNKCIYYMPPTQSDSSVSLVSLMEDTIREYNAAIATAANDEEKIDIIGKTIQRFERIHPFPDANGRTFVNLLLNYLLMKEGFPPATLIDPNLFDAFGFTSAVIKNGIANTLEIYNGNKKLFGFTQTNPKFVTRMNTIMDEAELNFADTHMKLLKPELLTPNLISTSLFSRKNNQSTEIIGNKNPGSIVPGIGNVTGSRLNGTP